jgi:toxin ParE1/3/4
MIEWTEQATRQLDQAHHYVALSNSEETASHIVIQIVTNVQQLEAFPMSGRAGRVPGTRELVIANTPFIAAYVIHKARIVILAVYRGAQQCPSPSKHGEPRSVSIR